MTPAVAAPRRGPSVFDADEVRVEGSAKVSGRAAYVADVRRPNALYAAFATRPHAHARIAAIDVSAALALPGVLGVVTGAELRARTHLGSAEAYNYTCRSGPVVVDGLDDHEEFAVLLEAFEAVEMKREETEQLFTLVAGLLQDFRLATYVLRSHEGAPAMMAERARVGLDLVLNGLRVRPPVLEA